MTTTIHLVDHLPCALNEQGIACGQSRLGLSEQGRADARHLRFQRAEYGMARHLYSSSLPRALETAQALATDDVAVVVDDRLMAVDYGELEGAVPMSHIREIASRHIDLPYPGGESYTQVARRFATWLVDLSARHGDEHIALVAHHDAPPVLAHHCNGLDLEHAFELYHRAGRVFWRRFEQLQQQGKLQPPGPLWMQRQKQALLEQLDTAPFRSVLPPFHFTG